MDPTVFSFSRHAPLEKASTTTLHVVGEYVCISRLGGLWWISARCRVQLSGAYTQHTVP